MYKKSLIIAMTIPFIGVACHANWYENSVEFVNGYVQINDANEFVKSDFIKESLSSIFKIDVEIKGEYITREEFCEILYINFSEFKDGEIKLTYIDENEITKDYTKAVNWATAVGLFVGNEKQEFMPQNVVKLNEYSVVLERLNTLLERNAEYLQTKYIKSAEEYVKTTVSNPIFSVTGGEWAVLGLLDDKEFSAKYYENLCNYLAQNDGVLSARKNTEYARVVIALCEIGKNPKDVDGYDLTLPLFDVQNTANQGVNGAIYALLALEKAYPNEENDIKRLYLDEILSYRLESGAFSLDKKTDYIDITAMAIEVLSIYKGEQMISEIIDNALNYISKNQSENGGFMYDDAYSSATIAQVTNALSSMNIKVTDERFVKNNNTLLDALAMFEVKGNGFKNSVSNDDVDLMSTEQILYALKKYTVNSVF